ncbi:MAG: hypothetical protein ACRDNK_14805 [Solirubrobacteraceae bacterium]
MGTERRTWADGEMAGDHGRTVFKEAAGDEAHPEISPRTPRSVVRKVAEEAKEGRSPLQKVKRAAEEIDREIAGEPERKEDPTAD